MAVRFSCPECAQLVEVGDNAAGMQVRCGNCHSAVRAPFDSPSPEPRRAGSPEPHPAPDVRAGGRRPDVRQGGGVRWLPLALSGMALVVALIALLVACLRDPFGHDMSKYDFSTPKAAVQSQARIEANGDVRAWLELQTRMGSKKAKERAKTLQVHREVSHRKYKVLFISFEEDGLTKNEVEVLEKDGDSGQWRHAYGGSAFEVREDGDLREEIQRWERESEEPRKKFGNFKDD